MKLENATPYPANFTLTFDKAGHEQIVLVTKGTFALPADPRAPTLVAPAQLPLTEADLFGPDPGQDAVLFENDFAAHKPLCDVLCSAQAHAPGGAPVTELGVGIRLGGWAKRFTVHGPRIWLRGAAGYHPSAKRAFVTQPISYDQAYGGVDPAADNPALAAMFQRNPAGLGYYPGAQDREGLPLAQTAEDGIDAVNPDSDYTPMAFGPVGRNWLPRRSFAGTYDDPWLEWRLPFLPQDFDERYFQAAATDQQIPYPQGGEVVQMINLAPQSQITGQIPRLHIVVQFLRKSGRVTQRIADLDTVLLLPEQALMCLTWRTHILAERDLFEFAQALVTERLLDGADHHPVGGSADG